MTLAFLSYWWGFIDGVDYAKRKMMEANNNQLNGFICVSSPYNPAVSGQEENNIYIRSKEILGIHGDWKGTTIIWSCNGETKKTRCSESPREIAELMRA